MRRDMRYIYTETNSMLGRRTENEEMMANSTRSGMVAKDCQKNSGEFDPDLDGPVQCSADESTVWVHDLDGSTVGRFSKRFGMDVHTSVTQQLSGAGQCLHCTHEPAGRSEWLKFCDLMVEHHGIGVMLATNKVLS